LPARQDHCATDPLQPPETNLISPEDLDGVARDEAWRTAAYFKSLRKVGNDALLYQASE
jgi:hypothetical protein